MDHLKQARTNIHAAENLSQDQESLAASNIAIAHALIALVETMQESNNLRSQSIDDLVHERLQNYINSH